MTDNVETSPWQEALEQARKEIYNDLRSINDEDEKKVVALARLIVRDRRDHLTKDFGWSRGVDFLR